MTEIRDGEQLSIDIPERSGPCFAVPLASAGTEGAAPVASAACAAIQVGSITPPSPARLVAAGAATLEPGAVPVRFALRFTPEPGALEPTPEAARDFAAREAASQSPAGAASSGGEGGSVDILAVGGSPATGAVTGDVVAYGAARFARATFTLDLRERGRDVPVHFVSYGAWCRDGLYVLSVEGDAFHAAAIDAFAEDAARTITLEDPAPEPPSDVAVIGARLGQIGLGILVMLAIVLAILGARTRKGRD